MSAEPVSAAPVPLDEQLRHALATDCATVLDEGDIANVVATVLPIMVAEYDRGIETGDYFARKKLAHRLGLGDVKP